MQKGKGKGKSGSFNGICFNCGKSGHSAKFCYAKGGKTRGKEGRQQRLMKAKVGQPERDGQKVKVGTSGEGWEQQRPSGMTNL